MKISNMKNDKRLSDYATQKDIENYLLFHYCIPRKVFRSAVSTGRKNDVQSVTVCACDRFIIVFIVPRKMFIASCPAKDCTLTADYTI